MQDILTVIGLTKRFTAAGPPVVNNLTFSVRRGEIFALLGPSGCGKTTTLRLIAGFEDPDGGEIEIADRRVAGPNTRLPAEKRGVGLVFQDFALFPHLNVRDNVGFGLQAVTREERNRRVKEVIRLVGLTGYETRRPHELSGGQQQRVAIARTLAPEPAVILLDEPFSNLDALLRQTTRQEIRDVLKRAGMTAVMVTHDQEEALSFADRVAVMRSGQIEQVGTPEEVYYQPRTLFVAQFLGRTNLLLSVASGMEADTPVGRVALNRKAEGNVLLSLRPEHLTLEPVESDSRCAGRVVAREFKGHDITFKVLVDDSEYLVHTHNRIHFQPGDAVCIRPLEAAVVLEGQTPAHVNPAGHTP
ncbi:MAG: ABC transporter ATP-binding protein [Rhodothermales bacterium]